MIYGTEPKFAANTENKNKNMFLKSGYLLPCEKATIFHQKSDRPPPLSWVWLQISICEKERFFFLSTYKMRLKLLYKDMASNLQSPEMMRTDRNLFVFYFHIGKSTVNSLWQS